MQLIRGTSVLEIEDAFIADGDPLPATGQVLVSMERWVRDAQALRHRGGVGVRVRCDSRVEELEAELAGLELIELEFPRFTDGRAYSSARLLRERYHYQGELRAVGDVLPDQLPHMRRCGIDSFRLQPGKSVATALAALAQSAIHYQPATDGARPPWRA